MSIYPSITMESIVTDPYGYDLVYLGDKIQKVEYKRGDVEYIVMAFTWKGGRLVDIKCFTKDNLVSYHYTKKCIVESVYCDFREFHVGHLIKLIKKEVGSWATPRPVLVAIWTPYPSYKKDTCKIKRLNLF